jgi:hypothetical protein
MEYSLTHFLFIISLSLLFEIIITVTIINMSTSTSISTFSSLLVRPGHIGNNFLHAYWPILVLLLPCSLLII